MAGRGNVGDYLDFIEGDDIDRIADECRVGGTSARQGGMG